MSRSSQTTRGCQLTHLLTLLFPFALFLPRVGLSLDLQFAHFLPRTAVCKGRNRVAVVPVVRLFASLIIIRHTAPTAAPAQCFTPFHLSAAPVVALRVSVRTSVPRNTPPPARRRPRSGRAGSSPSALGGRSGAAFATAWASAPPISTRGATRSGPGWRGQPAPPLGRTARVPGAAIAVRRGRVRRRAAPAAGRRGRAGDRSAGRGKTAGRGRAAVAVTVTAVGRGRARRGAAARVEPALVAWSGSGRTGARTRGRARAAARRRRRGWSTTTSRPLHATTISGRIGSVTWDSPRHLGLPIRCREACHRGRLQSRRRLGPDHDPDPGHDLPVSPVRGRGSRQGGHACRSLPMPECRPFWLDASLPSSLQRTYVERQLETPEPREGVSTGTT